MYRVAAASLTAARTAPVRLVPCHDDRRPHRRSHRPPPGPDPQRVRERRHARVGRGGPQRRPARRRTSRARRLDIERYEPQPGRRSLLAKIEGSDPTAPSLLLMGHTDVVPVNVDGWSRDPFGGELVDGMIWGRGAVDMLNLTATMAVAFRRLADVGLHARRARSRTSRSPTRRRSAPGARSWLVEHELDARAGRLRDHRVGRVPGARPPTGPRLPVMVEEKGTFWSKHHGARHAGPRVAAVPHRQRARHRGRGRAPPRRVPAADRSIGDTWRRYVEGLGLPDGAPAGARPGSTSSSPTLPLGLARIAHSCTHTTFAPTVVHGGTKTNVIPDRVDLEVDIRTLPGQSGRATPRRMLRRGARRPRRPGRDRRRTTTRRPRRRSTRRCGTRWHG